MPIYEYECPHCHNVFEEWVKLSCAHGEEPCPKCGTSSPRVISHTSFVLKGEGWYVTEYGYRKNVHEDQGPDQGGEAKKEDSPNSADTSKGDAAKSEASPSQASENKPAEASQSKTTPKPATDAKSSPKKQESSSSA
ncbi:MAG: zinc ribbon domain-containing protein [Desulfovibrionaceae bacterium]|nr:zinc ribbon domain-containing protein [Desulfovibrionaceae bacterium]